MWPLAAGLLAAASPALAQGPTDIVILRLAPGAAAVTGTPIRVTDRDGYDNQPSFTADGAAVLYTSIRAGQADTYRYALSTGATVRITATAESEYSPTPVLGEARFSVVRVEADSAQRLWSFRLDGTEPRLVLERIAPVGYHAWLDADRLILFVLGDPPTLRLADRRTGTARVAADRIGRSLQKVPGRDAATFTEQVGDEWWIRELDPATLATRPVAPLMGGDDYHVWTPEGVLLTAHGTRLYRWQASAGEWREIGDVARFGLGPITRLALSPDGALLAAVVDRPAP